MLDTNYIRDKVHCPLCNGHAVIDTKESNAFGIGLNAEPLAKNPYKFSTQHKLFVNFRIGQKAKSDETMKQAWEKYNASINA